MAYEATQITAEECTGDSDEHGNSDAAGIFAGYDELRDSADDKANDSGPEQTEYGRVPSRIVLEFG